MDRNVYMYVNTLHTFRTYFNLITKNLNYSENYAYLKIQILSFQKKFVTWGKICPKSCRNFCSPPKFWKWFFRYFCASKQKKNIFSCFASKLGSFKKKIQKKILIFFGRNFRARAYVADPAEFHHPNNFFGTPYAWPYFPVKINAVAQIGRKLFRCKKCCQKMDNLRLGPPWYISFAGRDGDIPAPR